MTREALKAVIRDSEAYNAYCLNRGTLRDAISDGFRALRPEGFSTYDVIALAIECYDEDYPA